MNRLLRTYEPQEPAAYPEVHHLTAPLGAYGCQTGDADVVNLWAGQTHELAAEMPAAQLVTQVHQEHSPPWTAPGPASPGAVTPMTVPIVIVRARRSDMPEHDESATPRGLWTVFEPYHALAYFAPEAHAAHADAGLKGFWMGYFASRGAALGPVPASVITATFYTFAPRMVERAISDTWRFSPPERVLAARLEVADAALRRAPSPGRRHRTSRSGTRRRCASTGSTATSPRSLGAVSTGARPCSPYEVERQTDRLALPPLHALGAAGAAELYSLLLFLGRTIVAQGGIPRPNPVGVPEL